MSIQGKYDALNTMYQKATDIDNHARQAMLQIIDPSMLGRLTNDVQSYDYMENDKYNRIETLIGIMKETFGSEVEELMKQKAEEEEAARQAALAA